MLSLLPLTGGEGMKRPIVKSPGRKVFRIGRGFSLGELAEVGLDIDKARRLGIAVDRRRRSVRKENIEDLKAYIKSLAIHVDRNVSSNV